MCFYWINSFDHSSDLKLTFNYLAWFLIHQSYFYIYESDNALFNPGHPNKAVHIARRLIDFCFRKRSCFAPKSCDLPQKLLATVRNLRLTTEHLTTYLFVDHRWCTLNTCVIQYSILSIFQIYVEECQSIFPMEDRSPNRLSVDSPFLAMLHCAEVIMVPFDIMI